MGLGTVSVGRGRLSICHSDVLSTQLVVDADLSQAHRLYLSIYIVVNFTFYVSDTSLNVETGTFLMSMSLNSWARVVFASHMLFNNSFGRRELCCAVKSETWPPCLLGVGFRLLSCLVLYM